MSALTLDTLQQREAHVRSGRRGEGGMVKDECRRQKRGGIADFELAIGVKRNSEGAKLSRRGVKC